MKAPEELRSLFLGRRELQSLGTSNFASSLLFGKNCKSPEIMTIAQGDRVLVL